MTKYTAADVREKRISFKGLTEEQFLKLRAHFHKLYPEDGYTVDEWDTRDGYHRFYANLDNASSICYGSSMKSYLILKKHIKSTQEITFDEFDFEEVLSYGGDITDFPIEVVEKMLERQVEQGNPRDVKVFERKSGADKAERGFDWVKICRDLQSPKRDNLVDGAGYFGCIDKMGRE